MNASLKPADPQQTILPYHSPPQRLWLSIAIGLVAVILTAVLVTQAEMVLSTVHIGYLQLPPVAVGILLLLLAGDRAARRLLGRIGLGPADVLVIYIMALVAAMVSSHGVAQKLVPLLVIPNYFANRSNGWSGLFGPHTPASLVPYRPSGEAQQPVAVDYYEKLPRGMNIPWHAWITPLLTWGVLIILVLFAFLCLASLVRRLWMDEEKLSFPLAQLPIQLISDGGSIFGRRVFQFGVAVPVLVYILNGIHQNLPAVPSILLEIHVNQYLPPQPWGQMDYTPAMISFAAIGFFYLLPVDILLSIWFFFVLSRLAQVGSLAANVDPVFLYHSIKYQTIGAYMVLVGTIFWSSRRYWRDIWKSATGHARLNDENELLSYPVAFWGLAASILLSAVWLWRLGMSPWLALFEVGACLFVIGPVMARSTAEAGLLMTEATFRPIDIYSLFAPVHNLGATNLTMLAFFDALFLRDQKGLLLTGFLDSLKIAEVASIPRRRLLPPIAIGVLTALVVAVGLNVFLPYRIGGLNMDQWMEQGSSRWMFSEDATFMNGSTAALPHWATAGSALSGFVTTAVLYTLRKTFFWWPLHPLGYVLIGTWTTVQFWFPCLIAWVFKSLSIRYGGARFVTQATPFFLGMIVGEFGMAVLFAILNIMLHIQAPPFPF